MDVAGALCAPPILGSLGFIPYFLLFSEPLHSNRSLRDPTSSEKYTTLDGGVGLTLVGWDPSCVGPVPKLLLVSILYKYVPNFTTPWSWISFSRYLSVRVRRVIVSESMLNGGFCYRYVTAMQSHCAGSYLASNGAGTWRFLEI